MKVGSSHPYHDSSRCNCWAAKGTDAASSQRNRTPRAQATASLRRLLITAPAMEDIRTDILMATIMDIMDIMAVVAVAVEVAVEKRRARKKMRKVRRVKTVKGKTKRVMRRVVTRRKRNLRRTRKKKRRRKRTMMSDAL